jgi:asparagine synthase (glutamine-hydrolysing)
MCGIAGAIVPGNPSSARDCVERMIKILAHRGPDGVGLAEVSATAVAMCRLRIRSEPDATLPFSVPNARAVAFNGEIYAGNGAAAPEGGIGEVLALTGRKWRDLDGMYAAAVLENDGSLRLIRDRFGIKPLFVRTAHPNFAFSSEIPALFAAGGALDIELDALHELVAFGRTLDRRTVYSGIRELEPGEELVVTPDGVNSRRCSMSYPRTPEPTTDGDLRISIRQALERTLISDRQIGLALSGGLDSSILAFELRELGLTQVNTVSLILPDNRDGIESLTEIGMNKDKVSRTWQHTNLAFDDACYFSGLFETARRVGEPFRMSSLPLYFMLGVGAQRQGTAVLLLGEGADELFGGYDSYLSFDDSRFSLLDAIGDFYLGGQGGAYLECLLGTDAVARLRARLKARAEGLIAGKTPKQALLSVEQVISLEPLLRRSDHALMAASVEGRTPFLHGDVPTLSGSLLASDLWSSRETKRALRHAYKDIIPANARSVSKRALRAPPRIWRSLGTVVLDSLMRHAGALLSSLGFREEGVAAIRHGCAKGDTAAIPIAVALISTGVCLSRLAEDGLLADPTLTRTGCAAARAFATPSLERKAQDYATKGGQ